MADEFFGGYVPIPLEAKPSFVPPEPRTAIHNAKPELS